MTKQSKYDPHVQAILDHFRKKYGIDEEEGLKKLRAAPDAYDTFTVDEDGNIALDDPPSRWEMDIDEHGHVWNPPRPGFQPPDWYLQMKAEWAERAAALEAKLARERENQE